MVDFKAAVEEMVDAILARRSMSREDSSNLSNSDGNTTFYNLISPYQLSNEEKSLKSNLDKLLSNPPKAYYIQPFSRGSCV